MISGNKLLVSSTLESTTQSVYQLLANYMRYPSLISSLANPLLLIFRIHYAAKKFFQHSEDYLQAAIEDVREKGVSIKKGSKNHTLSFGTLHNKVSR